MIYEALLLLQLRKGGLGEMRWAKYKESIYIYIYIYVCVCVCVCVWIYCTAKVMELVAMRTCDVVHIARRGNGF